MHKRNQLGGNYGRREVKNLRKDKTIEKYQKERGEIFTGGNAGCKGFRGGGGGGGGEERIEKVRRGGDRKKRRGEREQAWVGAWWKHAGRGHPTGNCNWVGEWKGG